MLILAACAEPTAPAQAQATSARFATEPAQRWQLPDSLREISGLAVSPDGRLFAHDDETARIYEIDWRSGRLVKSFSLGSPALTGDFEGLAITPDGGMFWLTTSSGEIYRFREGEDGAHVEFTRFQTGLAEICEIEGLAYLAREESLILACKRNHARDMRDQVAIYSWAFSGDAELWRTLPEADLLTEGQRHFRPSSIDVDSRTGGLMLLSASDGALAELGPDGALLNVRALSEAHTQAEGVTVLPDGSLAIADEAGTRRNAPHLTIYRGLNQ